MKKSVCFLMVFILVFSSVSVLAETVNAVDEFTIHSGVTFGMTMDEVIAQEKNAGFIGTDVSVPSDFCNSSEHTSLYEIDGQMAGINGSALYYHFNGDGMLESAVYSFINEQPTVKEALSKKYGESDEVFSMIANGLLTTEAYAFFSNRAITAIKTKLESMMPEILDEASWRVDLEDGKTVVISYVSTKCLGYTFTFVSYQLYTTEEIDNIWNELYSEYTESQQQLTDDL